MRKGLTRNQRRKKKLRERAKRRGASGSPAFEISEPRTLAATATPAEVAAALREGQTGRTVCPQVVHVGGWRFQYTYGRMPDSPRALHQVSALLERFAGKTGPDFEALIALLTGTLRELGAPSLDKPAHFMEHTPIYDNLHRRMSWRWFSGGFNVVEVR